MLDSKKLRKKFYQKIDEAEIESWLKFDGERILKLFTEFKDVEIFNPPHIAYMYISNLK